VSGAKKAAVYVTVHDEQGESFTFEPGQELPAWAAKAITNPNVFAAEVEEKSTTKSEPKAEKKEPKTSKPATTATDAASGETSASDGEPPRAGTGSGGDAWSTYATGTLGLTVPEGAKKADIIQLVDDAKATKAAAADGQGSQDS
jgi:hypothetical protein